MHEKEAIKILSYFNKCVTVKADGVCETDRYIQAKKVAIKTLEKQIPKKPTLEGGRICRWISCIRHMDLSKL